MMVIISLTEGNYYNRRDNGLVTPYQGPESDRFSLTSGFENAPMKTRGPRVQGSLHLQGLSHGDECDRHSSDGRSRRMENPDG